MSIIGLFLGIVILILTLIFMKGVAMGEKPRILQAVEGHTIEVIGGQLISNKFFNLVAMLLTSKDYFGWVPLARIIFSENEPEGKFGSYCAEKAEITINLQKHFDNTCKIVQSEIDTNAKYLSFRASLWYDTLVTVLHECYHAVAWASNPEECKKALANEKWKQAIEEDCNSASKGTTFELFRDIDCEPASIAEEPFFSMRFMKFFIDHIKDGDEEWAIRQGIMVDGNISYYDGEDKDGLKTIREWMRYCEEGDPDLKDERWDAKLAELPNAAVNPAVMVAGASEEVEPATKEVQVKEEAQLPAVQSEEAEKAVFDTQVVATGDFAQAADDVVMVEAMNTALDNAQTIEMENDGSPFHDDMDGYVESELKGRKPGAASESLQAGIVAPWSPQDEHNLSNMLDKQMAEAVCTSCKQNNPSGAKFCCGCGKTLGNVKTACIFGEEVVLQPFGQSTAQPVVQPTQVQTTPQSEFITPTTQPATQTQQRYTQSLRTDLPNINMDVANMKRILEEVYRRMHNHCFGKCGFQVSGGATGNAVGWNPAFIGNILETINITDIPGATDLVIATDKYNSQTGKVLMKTPITDGTISGKITKSEEAVPSYAIYINNNGIECKRIFMVQKAFKMTTAGYSPNAVKAQVGNHISWVWDGADTLPTGGRRWVYKIENGVEEWL